MINSNFRRGVFSCTLQAYTVIRCHVAAVLSIEDWIALSNRT